MIDPGTDLKYMVRTSIEGFTMAEDDFSLKVTNRYGRVLRSMRKSNLFTDTDGNFYFTLDAVPAGVYSAVFTARLKDSDFADGTQQQVFVQHLVTVGVEQAVNCRSGMDSPVKYTRVTTRNLNDGTYVYDVDGNPIEDVNGNAVKLSMTAEEVKDLLEGHNANGEIDTIPEVMDAVRGLNENTEYTVMKDEDVDSMMSRVFGNDNNN